MIFLSLDFWKKKLVYNNFWFALLLFLVTLRQNLFWSECESFTLCNGPSFILVHLYIFVLVFYMFNDLRWEIVVCFVELLTITVYKFSFQNRCSFFNIIMPNLKFQNIKNDDIINCEQEFDPNSWSAIQNWSKASHV